MNEFFVSIGPKLSKKWDQNQWSYHGIYSNNEIPEMITNNIEVRNLCLQIDITKSSAIPGLSSKILKDAFLCLIPQITFIFNLSFSTQIFPDAWKLTNVIPLPKEGDLTKCTNYRPISLLPLPGKLIEKIVHERISNFLENHTLLDPNQGGFRKNNSTINSISNFTDHIYNSINEKQVSISVFIDFSKAFDTVNHKILLEKLKHLGIKHNSLLWIKNYLTNRQQRTMINNVYSDYGKIECGVPQGSILGPLLFLVYINDLRNCLNHSKSFLYADDTVLIESCCDIYTSHLNLQADLDNIANWCKGNKLTINTKKTKSMLFGSNKKLKNTRLPNLKLNGNDLEYVTHYKYLGIILDSTLTFKNQIQNTIKIVAHKISLLQKIRNYINKNAAIQIYKTMIVPYIDYGDIITYNISNKYLNKLQTLQDRALKICFKPRIYTPSIILHRSANLAFLYKRRLCHVYNFMYKQQNNVNRLDLRKIYTRRRDAVIFKVKKPKCEKYKHNIFYYGCVLWNNLTVKIRKIETFEKFKVFQKKQMLL